MCVFASACCVVCVRSGVWCVFERSVLCVVRARVCVCCVRACVCGV